MYGTHHDNGSTSWTHLQVPSFPNAEGMIDGTIHRIRRPSGPLQAEFYRADKPCHVRSAEVIVDADDMIILLVSGSHLMSHG